MLDPKANNWILPIKGEEFDPDFVANLGMKARVTLEPAVTFNQLNELFWPVYFNRLKLADLKGEAAKYGLDGGPARGTKAVYVRVLSAYWRKRLSGV